MTTITPNRYGPFCSLGEITITAGTAKPLSTNLATTGSVSAPNDPVTAANPVQYALAFEDIIISSPAGNAAGLYVVQYNEADGNGTSLDKNTVLLYIPKGSGPVSLKKYLGGSRLSPYALGVDAETTNDKVLASGVVGS